MAKRGALASCPGMTRRHLSYLDGPKAQQRSLATAGPTAPRGSGQHEELRQ